MRVLAALAVGTLLCVSCGKGDSNDKLFEETPASGGAGQGGSGGTGGSAQGGSGSAQGGTGGSAQGGTGGTGQSGGGAGQGGTGTGGTGGTGLCTAGTSLCDGNVLMTCFDSQVGYMTVATCEPGRCDDEHGECDICDATDALCVDAVTAARCDATGQQMVPAPCEASTPYCVESGRCVECAEPQHCPLSASECLVAVCKDNACAFEPVLAGVACGVGGNCDGNGLCTYCTPGQKTCSGTGAPMECDAQGQWVHLPACATPTPYCKEGVCVQCQSVYQCPASGNECMSSACSASGTCGFTAKIATTPCSDQRQCDGMGACLCTPGTKSCQGNTPRTCSAAGAWIAGSTCSGGTPTCLDGECVECMASYDCPTPGVCMTAVCAANACSETPSAYGTPCVGGACDGQGVCIEGGGGTGGGAAGGSYAPSYLEGNAIPVKCGPRRIRLFGHCFP